MNEPLDPRKAFSNSPLRAFVVRQAPWTLVVYYPNPMLVGEVARTVRLATIEHDCPNPHDCKPMIFGEWVRPGAFVEWGGSDELPITEAELMKLEELMNEECKA